jgi:putative phage-type endonuclease
MIQGSPEWHQARLGKVTASRVADVMAKTKTGPAAARQNYLMELLCQRLTGVSEQGFVSDAMNRGTELEPIARANYEAERGLFVVEVGLVDHPEVKGFAASPDGLVGDDGMIEIKCPNTATHVSFLETLTPDGKYQWQMLAQMVCTGRQWCDFVSFDDRLPGSLQMASVRFERDEKRISEMLDGVTSFLKELDDLEARMRARMNKAA